MCAAAALRNVVDMTTKATRPADENSSAAGTSGVPARAEASETPVGTASASASSVQRESASAATVTAASDYSPTYTAAVPTPDGQSGASHPLPLGNTVPVGNAVPGNTAPLSSAPVGYPHQQPESPAAIPQYEPGQQPVQAQQPNYPAARPTNVLSIITLILGVLGFAIAPVITGHLSLSQIKRSGEDGKVMAIVGLVLGYLGVAAYAVAFIVLVVFIGFGFLAALLSAASSGYYYN
jgi:hypothetical protein